MPLSWLPSVSVTIRESRAKAQSPFGVGAFIHGIYGDKPNTFRPAGPADAAEKAGR